MSAAEQPAGRDLASIDGDITPLAEARISVLDHCFLYGDGVFEGIRFLEDGVLFHREHLDRLYQSAAAVRIPMVPPAEYERRLFDVVRASALPSGYVRVVVTRGVGALDINPRTCRDPRMVIIVASLKLYEPSFYDRGLHIVVARTQKVPFASFDCRTKACNYLNNVMATWEFLDRGAGEAIQTDAQGIVSEATVDNIFGVRGNELFTPGADTNCLLGITRAKVMELAAEQGLRVTDGRFTPRDFMDADEVFLTGTGAGLIPVTQVEHRTIGAGTIGPVTRALRETYESRLPEYCTPVGLKIAVPALS